MLVKIDMSTTSKPTIDGYEILSPLGQGGMATVWLAIQISFDRQVAIKFMSESLADSEEFNQRFLQEAKTVAKLDHRGIVTVYDMGRSSAGTFIAMEYLPGADLKQRIKSNELDRNEAVPIVIAIADALNHAHDQNVVHRDIKPANILFRKDGSPVLVDFGIARNLESTTQLTVAGKVMGTPAFMSPEQCRGAATNFRTDIYSLTVLLFYLLESQLPFSGDTHASLALQHTTSPIPALSAASAHLQSVIDKGLAKNPQDRFNSARELAEALEAAEKNRNANKGPSTCDAPTEISRPASDAKKSLSNNKIFYRSTGLAIGLTAIVSLGIAVPSLLEKGPEFNLPGGDATPQEANTDSSKLTNADGESLLPASALKGTTSNEDLEQLLELSLTRAKVLLWNGNMFYPPVDNALHIVGNILADYPENREALVLQERLINTLREQIEESIISGNTEAASEGIRRLRKAGLLSLANELEVELNKARG